jgi:hypothetical protein
MKPGRFWILLLLMASMGGCTTADRLRPDTTPTSLQSFIGTWEGEHVDSDGRLVRSWIQKRLEDGTYTIIFKHYTEKGAFTSRQQGKWWVEGDKFYEMATEAMSEPDVYEFTILDENAIHFKSLTKDYEFTDRRHNPAKSHSFI